MTEKAKRKEEQSLPTPFINLTNLVRVHAPTITKILRVPSASAASCCCGCCCCGTASGAATAAPQADPVCSVDAFMVNQELRLDPNSFGVPGGPLIVGARSDISWSVTAPVGATVTVQVRTRGLNGVTGGRFPDWTDQFTLQALIDSRRFNFDDVLGTRVEFRIVVVDGDGATLCVGAPDS